MKSVLRQLPSFLGPGLLLFLLAVQIAAASNGFQGSENGLLRLLEVPAVLLGWGGVALLLPLLLWMVLDWWGYTPSGFALKSLGAMSLGVACAAVAGLAAGHAGGGVVGSSLAELLGDTLGTPIAAILLVAMAAPAGVLAFSRLGVHQLRAVASTPATPSARATPKAKTTTAGRSKGTKSKATAPRAGLRGFSLSGALSGAGDIAKRALALIPHRRQTVASDLEALARNSAAKRSATGAPKQFPGARDVGTVRYADEPESPATEEDALPTIAEVLSGKYEDELALESDPVYEDVARPDYETKEAPSPTTSSSDEGDDEDTEDLDGPIHVDADGNIVRSAPIRPVQSPIVRVSRDETPDREVTHIGESGPPASLRVRSDDADDALPPGVRWADEPAASAEVSPAFTPTEEPEVVQAPPIEPAQPISPQVVSPQPVSPQPVSPQPVSPQPGLKDAAPEGGDGDLGVPRDLPRAEPLVLDALRGTTAQRAAKRQAARRPGETRAEERNVVRTAMKDSMTKLAQAGPTETHLRKLEATGLFDLDADKRSREKPVAPEIAVPRVDDAAPPPPKSEPPRELSAAAKAEAARRAAQKALVHQLRGDDRDPQFGDAVELALQRGDVSLVLLSRKLRTSYARSRALLDRLVQTDVVTKANEHGSHRTLLTAEFWAEVQSLAGE